MKAEQIAQQKKAERIHEKAEQERLVVILGIKAGKEGII